MVPGRGTAKPGTGSKSCATSSGAGRCSTGTRALSSLFRTEGTLICEFAALA